MPTLHRDHSRGNCSTARSSSPVWTRWLVLAVALLFGTVSTAQAAHVHRPAGAVHHLQGLPSGTPSADTEEHCPLCVAMHAALPAPMHLAAAPVSQDDRCEGVSQAFAAITAWHFARFSRPPPARA